MPEQVTAPLFDTRCRPRGGYRCNPTPQLTINGRWMEKFGFDTGKLAIITVERGKMVIELDINL
ncbi:SymE family type I addiction module toxin [Pantoea ananatis]|uniref:SymE family type I addiction module toxin n=1 Tax=Pantoea ananas TaxID=553 RepID=UPI000DD55A50|nr:SymE family type I addiction module toxin [Pantoea ananatis]